MRTHTRTSLILALLVCLAAAPSLLMGQEEPPPQPPPDPELEAAQNVMQGATPEEQVELAEHFLEQYPESPYRARILMVAAGAHRMLNHLDEAVEYGERALELNPRDPVSLLVVADALSEGANPSAPNYDERLNQAEVYSQRALELLPELFQSVPRRPDVPEEQYKLRENYMLAQARATLGYIYLRREQLSAAEQELRLATELNQLQPNAADYERLGVALVQQKKYKEAGEAFQNCSDYGGPAFENCRKRLDFVEEQLKKQPQLPDTLAPPPVEEPSEPQPPAAEEDQPQN